MVATLYQNSNLMQKNTKMVKLIHPNRCLDPCIRNFPCQTVKISKVSIVVMGP